MVVSNTMSLADEKCFARHNLFLFVFKEDGIVQLSYISPGSLMYEAY